jgi:hypothetical protein
MSTYRILAAYDFECGATLRIIADGAVDTLAAIEMAETLLRIKRKEIEGLIFLDVGYPSEKKP